MSIIPPEISRNLQFYLSGPLPCPYLPDRVERKLFTRLDAEHPRRNADINAILCRAGFRRSHDVLYRPACNGCSACIPVRIPVRLFDNSRAWRRVAARNADLTWLQTDAVATDELFMLFSAYEKSRHSDSDMARMISQDFATMLQEGQAQTHLYLLRNPLGHLKGCMIADPVGDGFSAVYSFFDPNEPRRSLGSFLVLALIEEARRRNWPFIYLGYWITGSRKMSYKTRFQPLQFLSPQGWDWLDPAPHINTDPSFG
jgi:arginine-tRNA-protein transferase